MSEDEPDQLRNAIETHHGCVATLVQSVSFKEELKGITVWEGVVYVFELSGHPKAPRAYAWSLPVGGGEHRLYAALHLDAIASPIDAVREILRGQGSRFTLKFR